MHTSRAFLFTTLAATSLSFGCQVISAIITSPSDSISGTGHAIGGSIESISDGVSMSSGSEPASDKSTYEKDLREYTASFVRAGSEPSTFSPGATRIAAGHGITNWETNGDTADAIGEGLLDAKQNAAQAEVFCSSVGLSPDLSKKVVSEVD